MIIDPQLEQRRQTYLDHLYAISGRTDGTYTGLFRQRQQLLLERDMEAVLDAHHQP